MNLCNNSALEIQGEHYKDLREALITTLSNALNAKTLQEVRDAQVKPLPSCTML